MKKLVADFYEYRKSSGQRRPTLEIRHIIMPNETATQLLKFRSQWLTTADTVRFNAFEPGERIF
jgi:hypothetical protein